MVDGTRIARMPDGSSITIPEMSYEQWKEWQAAQSIPSQAEKTAQKWYNNDVQIGQAFSGATWKTGYEKRLDYLTEAKSKYGDIERIENNSRIIAQNTGLSEKDVERVRQHIFIDEHDLGNGKTGRFDPDIDMADAWLRLTSGDYRPSDLLLLEHEMYESILMEINNYDYVTAHKETNKIYNWFESHEEERMLIQKEINEADNMKFLIENEEWLSKSQKEELEELRKKHIK